MITLDTNILVRYLVRDVVEQADAASRLLETLTAERPGLHLPRGRLRLSWSGYWSEPITSHGIASPLLLRKWSAVQNSLSKTATTCLRL